MVRFSLKFQDKYNLNPSITTFGKCIGGGAPIGAIGLRLKNWITYHGLSFNINPDMHNYDFIKACGLENFKNTSLKELGIHIKERKFDKEFESGDLRISKMQLKSKISIFFKNPEFFRNFCQILRNFEKICRFF